MRVLYIFLLSFGSVFDVPVNKPLSYVAELNDDYSILLRAEVESIEIKSETPSSVALSVHLEMELFNSGTRPVMFLTSKPPEIRGWALAKRLDDFSSAKYIYLDYFGESVDRSPEWTNLRNELDQASPPLDLVSILKPNESWRWKGTVKLSLPRSDQDKDGFSKSESWENITRLPTVWLQTYCQVWSLNLERKKRTRLKFGRTIQKRWKKVGLLLLDDIRSKPTVLDLRTSSVQ